MTARHIAGRTVSFEPQRDGRADPGEIVWVKVAYEDNPFVSKDRPVLVVGRRDERTVLALQLSSQAHHGGQPNWYPIGSGSWDRLGRPSWIRLDRVLELHDGAVRREAEPIDPEAFRKIATILRTRYGWK